MKLTILLSAVILLSIGVSAQTIGDLFQQRSSLTRDFHKVAGKYQSLKLNASRLTDMGSRSMTAFKLQLPFENKLLTLDLHKSSITASDFSVVEAGAGGQKHVVNYSGAQFYQGTIEGKNKSFATISIFNNQVMGVLADEQSNIILGAVENKGIATDEYTLYRDKDLSIPDPFSCATSDVPIGGIDAFPKTNTALRPDAVGEPIEIYFECDNKFYVDKGSNTNNVINYVLGFFNNTALLYANENVKIQVSQILVWTTQDPEAAAAANTTSDVLTSFSARMATANFKGDFAHFLSTRSLGGGIAYILSNPCSSPKQYHTGVSAINNSYSDFPTYSWTVEVVTHELGHNLGSNHTQWCGWTGGALDNCYPTEGGCAAGPAPTNGGTIMSYCHLTSYGINLSNGFGQQPGDRIRAVIAAATCYGTCRMTLALSKVDASCGQNNGTANVIATNGTGALTYSWSNGQTTAALNNVAPGTYNVTVNDASGCQVMGVVTLVNSGATLNATLSPSVPTSFCSGGNVVLTASNNVAYTYVWKKDGTVIGGATTNTYTATNSGTYSVTVTAGVCSVTNSVVITQLPAPTATISAGGPTTFCSGGSVLLNGNVGTGYSYQWYNGATSISGATSSTYSANASGSYSVKVAAGTCQSTSSSVSVTVNPSPAATATAAGPTTFCAGGTVTLNANTGTGLTYQWYNNGIAIASSTASSYLAAATGNYSVTVSLTSCQTTSSVVAVSSLAPPTANITAGGPLVFCAGGHVTLNASAGTGYSYQWYNNAVAIIAANSASYDAIASGNYTVKVSAGTCQATSSAVAVTVNPVPTASITAGGATSFCSGNSVLLSANTGTGLTYQWYNNTTAITGATNISLNANSTGSYSVKISSSGCQATSNAIIVTSTPIPSALITAGGPLVFCSGGHVTLNAGTGSGYNYQWYNNGVLISAAVAAIYDAVTSGNYTVKVSSGTCEATSTAVTVTENPIPPASISAGGPISFCGGNSVVLSANTGSGLTYQWYNNTTSITGATNASLNAGATGAYSVRISSSGCQSTSNVINVTSTPVPSAVITPGGPTAFCVGGNVNLNAPTGSGLTYQWFNNGVSISAATNPTYQGTLSGDYTVRVSNGTCQATSSAVTVTASPGPNAVINAAGPVNFCSGDSVRLQANGGIGYIYHWYRNGSAVSGANNISYSAITAGSYTVSIDLGTCTSTSSPIVVSVLASPTITVTPSSSTIQKFQSQSLVASGAATYNWSAQPSVVSSSGNTATVDPLSTTNYIIEGTDNNGCKDTTAVAINVIGCGDATNLLSNVTSPARTVISWTNPQDVSSDTLQYRKVGAATWTKIFVAGHTYEVNGLEPNTDYEYSVVPLCNSTSSYFASGISTFKTQPLGAGVYINLFPNPVVSPARLEVIMNQPFSLQATLYSLQGQALRTIIPLTNYPAGQVIKIIDPATLRSGLYNLVLVVNGKKYNLKMVVIH